MEGSSEESESSGNENELKTPVQEIGDHSHPQETKSHLADSKVGRKRKRASESDDTGKRKQNKLEKNADATQPHDDNGQPPNDNNTTTDSIADAATEPSITSSDSDGVASTSTTTAASLGASTAATTAASTATDTNKVCI